MSGTANSAAADGVGALKSATKSAIVKSVSCPTAEIIGISELYIFGDDVLDIIAKYPDVKMVMFLENAQSGRVHLCYSKSGYSTVTDTYMIGVCDTNSKSRWTLKNSPTEGFKEGNIEYIFKFSDDWEGLNYVFTDETGVRKQLGK